MYWYIYILDIVKNSEFMASTCQGHHQSLKDISSEVIDEKREELALLSNRIWENPELAFKEHKAHHYLTEFLEKEGFSVERSYTGIDTAFKATFGAGQPNVCVICEYDALPEIGHACGHNLIAEAGVAAGLGVKTALGSSGAPKGRITIMGTPAEEAGGGKIRLIKNGAFKDVDIAMMVHPFPSDSVQPEFICIASRAITYTGKAAHAAAFPWEGVNALDAAVMAYTSISTLRQQMKPTWRVHGIISNGGAKPNIIPEKSQLLYCIRAPSKSELDAFLDKVTACFEGAAAATGCKVEIARLEEDPDYLNIVHNPILSELYLKNIQDLGNIDIKLVSDSSTRASSDMGDVSFVVPSIHPVYAIGSGKEVNHSREFTAVANTPEAHRATLTAAKAMAHTCIDVLTTDGLLEKIRENHSMLTP